MEAKVEQGDGRTDVTIKEEQKTKKVKGDQSYTIKAKEKEPTFSVIKDGNKNGYELSYDNKNTEGKGRKVGDIDNSDTTTKGKKITASITTDNDGNEQITEIEKTESNLKDFTVYAFFENSADFLSYRYNSSLNGYEVISYSGSAKSVKIPATYKNVNVTSIGNFAFDGCSSLTSVEIPDSVTSIGYRAFLGCSGLTSITIPDSVTSIGDYVFAYCSSLTSITIPDSVTSIRSSVFAYCSSLTSIAIGKNVNYIDQNAFAECKNLKTLYVNSEYAINGENIDYAKLFDYAETVYIREDINVINSLFSVVYEKESENVISVDGVKYYKYVLKN